jgi:hypothetical protein
LAGSAPELDLLRLAAWPAQLGVIGAVVLWRGVAMAQKNRLAAPLAGASLREQHEFCLAEKRVGRMCRPCNERLPRKKLMNAKAGGFGLPFSAGAERLCLHYAITRRISGIPHQILAVA